MDLRYLSTAFYNKYKDCPEILTKGETRPYIILLVEVENNKFAIPIRTHLPNIKDRYITNPITNNSATVEKDTRYDIILSLLKTINISNLHID